MTGKIVSGSDNQNQDAGKASEAKKIPDLDRSTPNNHHAPLVHHFLISESGFQTTSLD